MAVFKSNLSGYSGFWNSVQCVDLNNDGKKDLILIEKVQNENSIGKDQNFFNVIVNEKIKEGDTAVVDVNSEGKVQVLLGEKLELVKS